MQTFSKQNSIINSQGIFGTVKCCNYSLTFRVATHLGYHIYFPTGLSKAMEIVHFQIGETCITKIAVATTPYFSGRVFFDAKVFGSDTFSPPKILASFISIISIQSLHNPQTTRNVPCLHFRLRTHFEEMADQPGVTRPTASLRM